MSGLGRVGKAALNCSVMEEDWQRGQSYTAHWHSPNLLPQSCRSTTTEAECSGKREARRLLQRFLSGAISQRLPKTRLARQPHHQPTSDASAVGSKVQRGAIHIQKETGSVMFNASEKKTVKTTNLPRFLG